MKVGIAGAHERSRGFVIPQSTPYNNAANKPHDVHSFPCGRENLFSSAADIYKLS